jgi:hypothetical protein
MGEKVKEEILFYLCAFMATKIWRSLIENFATEALKREDEEIIKCLLIG